MKKTINFTIALLVLISLIVFSPTKWGSKDNKAKDIWINQTKFQGEVKDIFYYEYDKMFYLQIDSIWYAFLRRPDFDMSYITGANVIKKCGEDGFWIIKMNNDTLFYKTYGSLVKKHKSQWRVNNYIEKKKNN